MHFKPPGKIPSQDIDLSSGLDLSPMGKWPSLCSVKLKQSAFGINRYRDIKEESQHGERVST